MVANILNIIIGLAGWFFAHANRVVLAILPPAATRKNGQGQKHPHLRHFRPCGYFGRLANYPFNRGIYRLKLAYFPNSQKIMKKFSFAVSLLVFFLAAAELGQIPYLYY